MKQCTSEGCTRPVLGRGLCAPHYSTWHRAQRKYTIACKHCGTETRVGRRSLLYCSRTCAALHNQTAATAARTEQLLAARRTRLLPVLYTKPLFSAPRKQRIQTVKGRTGRFFAGICRVCDTSFVSLMPAVTCSTECQATHLANMRRIGKDRRRARQRDAYVEDVYRKQVFDRDGYRCHLCRKKTDPTKQAPHPKAPTIDHLIPLSKQGTHEPVNCRTACFLCNSRRGDRGSGVQLLLIA